MVAKNDLRGDDNERGVSDFKTEALQCALFKLQLIPQTRVTAHGCMQMEDGKPMKICKESMSLYL